jgi:hypothetical protein
MGRDAKQRPRANQLENTMLRKFTLGLIAAASLTFAAAAPASAGGFYHGHHHWGHGHGYGWGPAIGVGVGFGGVYLNTGLNGCLQQRWVETRRGMRLRTVNVCAY